MNRRNWISLDGRSTRCVVLDDNGVHRLSAYQLTVTRATTAIDRRRWSNTHSPLPYEQQMAQRIHPLFVGSCCYAFYCKSTNLVKLGRTGNLLQRWSKLETEGGRLLQLVSIWKAADSASLERKLHQQFQADRVLGEWFTATAILDYLRMQAGSIGVAC